MLRKQAKTISPGGLRKLLAAVRKGAYPERDRVIVLLSVRAGLRACEIAGLTWGMALDPNSRISSVLDIHSRIAKRGSGRRVPIHPQLRSALCDLMRKSKTASIAPDQPVIRSARSGHMRANSIVNWYVTTFKTLNLEGCSSHSGRRTFITRAARSAHRAGASLRDVQILAGHRSIETTQGYIDGDTDAQRKLVKLL
ncbi:MAG: site-specific integrase [Alphaproteobacteria bacterium]|nr:site-specific integrase [Alphaproteobacteria bacterium]